MFFVYVIRSTKYNRNYTGLTSNFERRFDEHNTGRNKTTKPYRPFEIILIEEYPDRPSARKREKYLKSGIGREFIKSKIPQR